MKHCFFCSLLLFMNVMFLLIQQQQKVQQRPILYPQQRPPVPRQQGPPVQTEFILYPQQEPRPMPNRMVGYLTNDTGLLLPLYARPSPTHRHRYNYHTTNNGNHHLPALRLPVFHNKRDCTENLGCDELYEGSLVNVPGMEQPMEVKLYSKDFY